MMPGPRVLGAISAAAFALAATAGASFARSDAPGTCADGAELTRARAEADSLSARLGRLEVMLGVAAGEGDTAGYGFRARYASLRRREAETARRAAEWLRYVPGSEPVSGGIITSAFSPGRYHPIKLRIIPHVGLDIAARHGTPVRVTADGTVFATVNHPTYGLTVDVQHGASGFLTRYAHLSRIAVRPGTAVRRGDTIGYVGSTGLSTGPHTHYEVFYKGWRRDPIDFLPPGPVATDALLGAD
jgi:murein DD-endopeptidase MepM/ murein hydrolase activator NlpD